MTFSKHMMLFFAMFWSNPSVIILPEFIDFRFEILCSALQLCRHATQLHNLATCCTNLLLRTLYKLILCLSLCGRFLRLIHISQNIISLLLLPYITYIISQTMQQKNRLRHVLKTCLLEKAGNEQEFTCNISKISNLDSSLYILRMHYG